MAKKQEVITKKGAITKNLDLIQQITNLPPVSHDGENVRHRINEYFALCKQANIKPTVAGLALSLGIDRRRLWDLKVDAAKAPKDFDEDARNAVKQAYVILETLTESCFINGDMPPVTGIFYMKNHFGYKDVKEKVERQVSPLDEAISVSDYDIIEAKYKEIEQSDKQTDNESKDK